GRCLSRPHRGGRTRPTHSAFGRTRGESSAWGGDRAAAGPGRLGGGSGSQGGLPGADHLGDDRAARDLPGWERKPFARATDVGGDARSHQGASGRGGTGTTGRGPGKTHRPDPGSAGVVPGGFRNPLRKTPPGGMRRGAGVGFSGEVGTSGEIRPLGRRTSWRSR